MKALALILALAWSANSFAGNEGAHGGGGVHCTKSALNEFEGFYMLDYLVMRGGPGTNVWPYPKEYETMVNYEQILEWINSNMDGKLPILAQQLRDFRKTVFIQNPAAFRSWVPFQQLPRIYDQGMGQRPWRALYERNFQSRNLPPNCRLADFEQVAAKWIRWDNSEAYLYVPRLVRQFKDPIQVSYLVVHEWLRSYTDDAEAIRRSNRLLHSEAIRELSGPEIRLLLRNFGLFRLDQNRDKRP